MPDRRFFEEQQRRQRARMVGREQEAQAAMAKLASTAEPKDRFGQVLGIGDMVLYDPAAPNVFLIDDIVKTSALDPSAPPGLVTLRLSCQFQVHLNALQLPQNLIRVGFSTPEGPRMGQQTAPPEVTVEKVAEDPITETEDAPRVSSTPLTNTYDKDFAEEKPMPHKSALPCGCDETAGWICEQHRQAPSDGPLVTLTD